MSAQNRNANPSYYPPVQNGSEKRPGLITKADFLRLPHYSASGNAILLPPNYTSWVGETSGTGTATLHASTGNAFVDSPVAAHLTSNAYYDGTNWQRYNTGAGGYIVVVGSGGLSLYTFALGANPIALGAAQTLTSAELARLISLLTITSLADPFRMSGTVFGMDFLAPITVSGGDLALAFTSPLINSAGSLTLQTSSGSQDGSMSAADFSKLAGLFLAAPCCRVTHNAAQSITSGANPVLAMNTEIEDTHAYHSTVTNNSRMTIPSVALGGVYLIGGEVEWAGNATGERTVDIFKNGALNSRTRWTPGNANLQNTTVPPILLRLVNTDYIELGVFQSSGGALNVNSTSPYSPVLWMVRIGD